MDIEYWLGTASHNHAFFRRKYSAGHRIKAGQGASDRAPYATTATASLARGSQSRSRGAGNSVAPYPIFTRIQTYPFSKAQTAPRPSRAENLRLYRIAIYMPRHVRS